MKLKVWWSALRPATLPAAAAPVAVGSACAFALGGFHAPVALACLAGALLLQIAANFANDVYDFEKGADREGRLGPPRAVQQGWLTPAQMKRAVALVLLLAFLCGLYLVRVAGFPILVLGLASMLASLAYTAGPWPLAYLGLGDLFVWIFFGFVAVCGTAFAHLLRVPPVAWWSALGLGAQATAILVVNNLRDIEGDARAGKRTLAVRLGRRASIAEYALLAGISFLAPTLGWAMGQAPWGILLVWLAAPLSLWRIVRVARDSGLALNRSLAGTGRIVALQGLLLSLGLIVAR